jgi:acyl-homoserine lactone acylase PvdQ
MKAIAVKEHSKETTVYFDEFGVPHIYASKDAMMALDMFTHKIACGKWN